MIMDLRIVGQDGTATSPISSIRLDRHGALIGRSSHADWNLPDPQNRISSSHCEISYRESCYILTDRSTNGTFVNGSPHRLNAPHKLAHGDEIAIGHYRIVVDVDDGGQKTTDAVAVGEAEWATDGSGWPRWPSQQQDPDAWSSSTEARTWEHGGSGADRGWGNIRPARKDDGPAWPAPAQAAITGAGPLADYWAPPIPIVPPPTPESAESSPAFSQSDIWSRLADGHNVEWGGDAYAARSGAVADEPSRAATNPGIGPEDTSWHAFLRGAGLAENDIHGSREEVMETAGKALRLSMAGLLPMVEARSRAKAQMGAQTTILEFDGNNPLKFVRAPERALTMLLNPPQPGFMSTQRAIESAYRDLQAHQMATLTAMKGALRAALENFSPSGIRQRHGIPSGIASFLPMVENAKLWCRYEAEFDGVVRGSNEAFVDVFAKEFREAYMRHSLEDGEGPL